VTVTVAVRGAAADAVARLLPTLVADGIAGGITSLNPTL